MVPRLAHRAAIIIYDVAARGERERAVALWDEFATPNVPAESTGRNAAWKELPRNPESKTFDAMNVDPVALNIESGIAINRFDRMLDVAEQARKQARDFQQFWLRSAWLPSTLGLREQPRFFAFAERLGMVRMWETRGHPGACTRVAATDGAKRRFDEACAAVAAQERFLLCLAVGEERAPPRAAGGGCATTASPADCPEGAVELPIRRSGL